MKREDIFVYVDDTNYHQVMDILKKHAETFGDIHDMEVSGVTRQSGSYHYLKFIRAGKFDQRWFVGDDPEHRYRIDEIELDELLTKLNQLAVTELTPVLCEVSDTDSDGLNVAYVLGKIAGKYLAFSSTLSNLDELNGAEHFGVYLWNHAVPVPTKPEPTPLVELTLQEIAERLGIDAADLRIKE